MRLNRELLRYRASLVNVQTGIKNNTSHGYSDLFGKEGMDFLHSLSLSENYKMALEGYLSVLDNVRGEISTLSNISNMGDHLG